MSHYTHITYIGRFQPPHLAHIEIIKRALKDAECVIILVGSANQPRTIKNPWTWQEREEMIRASLPVDIQDRIVVRPLHDKLYNDQQWAKQVQDTVTTIANFSHDNPNIGIIGYSKDETSYYLKMFPQWKLVDVGNIEDIHATDIRTALWEGDDFDLKIGRNLPHGIHDFLQAFKLTDHYEQLVKEYKFIQAYKKSWEPAPYDPTFLTADAVVVQSGHVLLIRRRAEPGKNLWALPGGFVNQNETIKDAMIRELREETKLRVPEPVLRGSIKASEMFDHPDRSLRGRTVTQASLIELPPGPLPKVKGGDDADKAKWVPLSVFERMENLLFEDHYSIVTHMIGKL